MIRSWFSKEFIWNYPSWSIHAEWLAYLLVFPFAFLAFRRVSNRSMLMIAIGALIAAQTILPIDRFPGKSGEIVFLFLVGAALYRLRVLQPVLPGNYVVNGSLLLLAVAVAGPFRSMSLFYVAFAGLIFGLSKRRDGSTACLLSGWLYTAARSPTRCT